MPLTSLETERHSKTGEFPRRNGLFSIDDGLRGLGRLDGGGGSQRLLNLTIRNFRGFGNSITSIVLDGDLLLFFGQRLR